jgi:hypothetical protein
MEDNLIYALHCPITQKPVYVGKTKKGLDRPFKHIVNKSHSDKINEWVKLLNSEGREPVLVILDKGSDEEITSQKELFWINYYISKGHQLLNSQSINVNHLESSHINNMLDLDDPLNNIRVYIKIRRKQLKLTQLELSKKSGVGIRFIRELEQGKKINFNTEPMIKVLSLLGNGRLTIGI